MDDKHDTAFEIERWAIQESKEVHLALELHSSSHNEIDITFNIQNFKSFPMTVLHTPIICLVHCVCNMGMITGLK